MKCECGRPSLLKSRAICKTCYNREARQRDPERHNAYVRKYAKAKGSEWRFNRALLYNFGITIEVYKTMLADQGGVCAACGTDKPGYRKEFFCVDHDHATGRIRGLLCDDCNLALGKMKDDVENIRKLADYVEYWRTRPVPRLRKQLP